MSRTIVGPKQLVLLAVSSAISVAIAVGVWNRVRNEETVVVVDVSSDVHEILSSRAATDGGGPSRAPGDLEVRPDGNASRIRFVAPDLDDETRRVFFPQVDNARFVADPDTYFWVPGGASFSRSFSEHPSGGWRTFINSLGIRRKAEVLDETRGVRVLVAGDSHTAGVVPPAETFCERLEALWNDGVADRSAEVLNAGQGGFSFFNYLGVFEKFKHLRPDVFVLAVFGGNDFREVLAVHRYCHRLPPPPPPPSRWGKRHPGIAKSRELRVLFNQSFNQLFAFLHDPESLELATDAAVVVTREIARRCADAGIPMVCVFIPAFADAQPKMVAERVAVVRDIFDLSDEDLALNRIAGERFVESVRGLAIPTVDMRPVYAAGEEPAYWFSDHHINTRGHELIARELMPVVTSLIDR